MLDEGMSLQVGLKVMALQKKKLVHFYSFNYCCWPKVTKTKAVYEWRFFSSTEQILHTLNMNLTLTRISSGKDNPWP